MDVFEAINSRRSIRSYSSDPVPRAVLEKIVAAGVEAPSGCNMQLRQYVIVDAPATMEQLRLASTAMTGAPAAIVLLVEPRGTKFGEYYIQDASAAMQNMLLASVALGYGACWIEGAVRHHEERLRPVLAVPDTLRVWSIMPVGKPAVSPARPQKLAAKDVTHYNQYGKKEK